MNKREFYKELMGEYSFDAEKIKQNAKKGRFARQKISPIYGISAAVAVCTVTVGTLAVTLWGGGRNGVVLTTDNSGNLSELTASERVKNAIEQQEQEKGSTELIDVLVSFVQPLTPLQSQSVLMKYADGETMPIKTVYFSDGTKVSGDAISSVFEGGDASAVITGVAVNCAGYVMVELQGDPMIVLAEPLTESDLDTAVPIDAQQVGEDTPDVGNNMMTLDGPDNNASTTGTPDNSDDPLVIGTAETSGESRPDSTEETDTSESFDPEDLMETGTTEESFDAGDTGESHTEQDIDTSDTGETSSAQESEDPFESSDTGDTSDNSSESVGAVTSETSEQETASDIPPRDTLPQGVTLPEEVDKLHYNSLNIGAQSAYFISDSIFFVRTGGYIELHSFDGVEEECVASVSGEDAKICWVSSTGGQMIVSSLSEDGVRNKLWFVDAMSLEIFDLGAEDVVMDGSIIGVGYNEESKLLVITVKENGQYYVSAAELSNMSEFSYIGTAFESVSRPTLICSGGDNIYLAVTDGALTQIIRADVYGSTEIIKTYDSSPKISKNLAFTHGIIVPSSGGGHIEIFDPASGQFINTGYDEADITFGASKHSLCVNGETYFKVSGGVLVPAGTVADIAPIDYKKSFSEKYSVSGLTGGAVIITQSSYTKRSKTELLSFSHITDSCTAELKTAINGAIGINNVLATGCARESGITTSAALVASVEAFYSSSALETLKTKCDFDSYGLLDYTSGGLEAISVSDTALVINSQKEGSASGILYVRAGSFNGKTAYRSINVNFVYENGWKLNTVLG